MQLIKGTFKTQEALQIISQLVDVKIKFHENKISLSQNEEDIKMREGRIKELQKYLNQTRDCLNDYKQEVNMDAVIYLNEPGIPLSEFRLIDGTFDAQDAGHILMASFDNKIQFHSMAAFGKKIRGESGIEMHEERIKELQSDSKKLKEILKKAEESGKKVSINCNIIIKEMNSGENELVQTQEAGHSH